MTFDMTMNTEHLIETMRCYQKQCITIIEKHSIKYDFIWNSASRSVISSVPQFIKFESEWEGDATFP